MSTRMNFSAALEELKQGSRVARAGWNGKGMWLSLVPAGQYNTYHHLRDGAELKPWIGMKTADDCFVPWLASQSDILSEDWTLA